MKQAHTILIGAETYPPDINGAAQFGHRLATAMLGRGHEVHVVAASPMRGPSYAPLLRAVLSSTGCAHTYPLPMTPTASASPGKSTSKWGIFLTK